MGCLSNDEFFSRLAELFNTQKGKEHGAIYLSQRRCKRTRPILSIVPISLRSNHPVTQDEITSIEGVQPASGTALIIRASNGKSKLHRKDKVRLSTTVDPNALEAFYARYAETCKVGMTALKPRDKSKKKAKAKKKKAATTAVAP